MTKLIIGLMTGTSADGVDAALVCISNKTPNSPKVIATLFHPYPKHLQEQIITTTHENSMAFDAFFKLDKEIAKELADSVQGLLAQENLKPDDIAYIGSHGQTIRHRPGKEHNYTVQIGEPNTLTALTGIDVITDFRRADMAHGGQGAPFAPFFHEKVFRESKRATVILNMGGIANITLLCDSSETTGFDIGPANALMDDWIKLHKNESFDDCGDWAASGTVDIELLKTLICDQYFTIEPPKSTGREYFNTQWLQQHLVNRKIATVDVQATLCELSAQSIADAIKDQTTQCDQVFLCGGGIKNLELLRRLKFHLPNTQFRSTAELDIDPDFLEALLIAWLAHRHELALSGNLPSVTGSRKAVICGAKYIATKA